MNIGIVGAGIAGRLLAWTLASQKHKITLFDKTAADDDSTASFVAAGMLAPYSEIDNGEPKLFEMAKDAVVRWEAILSKLQKPVSFKQNGSLLLASPSERSELEHFMTRAQRLNVALKLLGPNEIANLEPDLANSRFNGIYLPEEAFINTHEIMQALAESLRALPVTWHENTEIISIANKTVKGDTFNKKFDQVFDCRGLGAKQDLAQLRAVRGEIIWLKTQDVNLTRPIRVLHPRYAIYVVPRAKDTYLLGATQIESDDTSPISVLSALELLSACYNLHPGFAEARIIKTQAQCRPALADNMPKIIGSEHCIHVNGLFRHGYLLAPKLVSAAVAYFMEECKNESVVK
jgi:glycine oxidase